MKFGIGHAKLALGCILAATSIPVAAATYLEEAEMAARIKCAASAGAFNAGDLNIGLSGGGYRAMLFHVGALWRLHELGMLSEATQISSVSGGSITAAVLALEWKRVQTDLDSPLDDDNRHGSDCFRALVATPLLRLAGDTIDIPAVIGGGADRLKATYVSKLFGRRTLAEVATDRPRFRFNATNLQTGAVFSFVGRRIEDPTIGSRDAGDVPLATAVAASSAFPPYLSPIVLTFPPMDGWTDPPQSAAGAMVERKGISLASRQLPEFRHRVVLVDGGVADNLGLEAIWHEPGRFAMSDGGGFSKADPTPATDWLSQVTRVMGLIHDQPSGLRAKTFNERRRAELDTSRTLGAPAPDRARAAAANTERGMGVYWSIAEPPPNLVPSCPPQLSATELTRLAQVDTRLRSLSEADKKRLVNWGYLAADYSLPYLESVAATYRLSLRLPYPEESILTPGNASGRCP